MDAASRTDATQLADNIDESIEFLNQLVHGSCSKGQSRWLELAIMLARLTQERAVLQDSADDFQAAERLYEMLLTDYPNSLPHDELLYSLGTSQLARDRPKGTTTLMHLLREFPDSPFVPLALIRVAEVTPESGDHLIAEIHLEAAANWDFDAGGFAMYKIAWSQHHQGQYEQALRSMIVAVTRARTTLDPLARETAVLWAETLGQKQATIVALERIPVHTGTCLDEMTDRRSGVTSTPLSHTAIYDQLAIVACLSELGQTDETDAALDRLTSRFGRTSAWYVHQTAATQRQARAAIRRARKAAQ